MVSELDDSAMVAPPTNQHRIEMLEQGLKDLHTVMAEQISVAVNTATQEMQKTLIEQLTNSLEQTTQRLEERIARSREKQDRFLNQLKGEHDKFEQEMRSTLTSLKAGETLQREFRKFSSDQRIGKGRTVLDVGDRADSGRPEGSGVGSGWRKRC